MLRSIFGLAVGFVIVVGLSFAAAAKTPSKAKVSADVTRYWSKTWSDQKVAHVARKSEKCLSGVLQSAGRRGRKKKTKTCLIKTDVYVEKGYRYFIYRMSDVHYKGNRLVSVQLGELEKAWKSGGIPAPEKEQIRSLLEKLANRVLGQNAQVELIETGTPRPQGDSYRLSLVVNVSFLDPNGSKVSKSNVLATIASEGEGWEPVAELCF